MQKTNDLILAAQSGDMVSMARLLTALEQMGPLALKHPLLLEPPQTAFRVGITGPPGAGKSTLISELLRELSHHFKRIGVVAIDPTSPLSQGAILGDRIRFWSDETKDVFVRSLGTRGSLGGLSAAAYLMLRAFDVCGFDLVLVETVGVGQVEVEIMNVADSTCLVLVPESGDSIQVMKSGIMEVADLFVVNKSDRPGADSLKREIEQHFSEEENKKVFLVSALNKTGIRDVSETLNSLYVSGEWRQKKIQPERFRAEAAALLRSEYGKKIDAMVSHVRTAKDLIGLFEK